MSFLAPRGTHDLFGEELDQLSEIISILKENVLLDGYQEIKTPIFEHSELFNLNKEEGLIPNKEFFFLEGKKYLLRPENTASIVRAVVQNKLLNNNTPLQFFYCGSFFRYERPQLGRYREFRQFGVEKINSSSIYDEIELIFLVEKILKRLNLTLELHLNYLGSDEIKKRWNLELKEYFSRYKSELTEISQERILKNPMRILDDKNDSIKEFVRNSPPISRYFSEEERKKIENLKIFLKKLKVDFIWDQNLVRGIDYYTGLVYEWKYKNLTIIAGGRYDSLFEKFIPKKVPCIGLAIGLERLKNTLKESGYKFQQEKKEYIYFASLLDSIEPYIFDFLRSIKDHGFSIKTNWAINRLKEHFKESEKSNSNVLLIFGAKEAEEKKITLKCSEKNYQKSFSLESLDEIVFELKSLSECKR